MTQRRRVAITGLGLVTPAGNDVAATWSALLAARSGVAPITNFDARGFPVRIAAEVKNLSPELVEQAAGDRKLLKLANRSHRFALVAASQAFADAGIRPTADTATRWGCVVGTGMMGVTYDELAEVQEDAASNGELEPGRLLAAHGLGDLPLVLRITGCPNGCARPYLAEVALVGKAPGRYNLHLGGDGRGQRLNVLYRENVDEATILAELDAAFARFAAERGPGERFGDFVWRAGLVAAQAAREGAA